jgi:hypothetical protein
MLKMKKTLMCSIVLLTATLLASAGVKLQRFDVSFSEPTTVAGVLLKAGDYQVRLNAEDTVAIFYHNGTEVAKAAVHSQANNSKYAASEQIEDTQTLKELHIGGSTTDLIIDGPAR